MDNLFELFKSIDYMYYYYTALAALLSAVWCFTRNSSIQTNFMVNDITHIHPEIQSGKARAGIYLFFGIVFVAITLFTGFTGYIRQNIAVSAILDDIVDSYKWDNAIYEKKFLTTSRFKDAVSIQIQYDLTIKFPEDVYQLQILKEKFQTPEEFFDHYMKPYLSTITAYSTTQMTAYEAYETKQHEFTEYIKNQVFNGIDSRMGVRSVDGFKSFKSLGIEVTVRIIHFTFEEAFLKIVKAKNKANVEVLKAEVELAQKQRLIKEAQKSKEGLMKEWIESGRAKKKKN